MEEEGRFSSWKSTKALLVHSVLRHSQDLQPSVFNLSDLNWCLGNGTWSDNYRLTACQGFRWGSSRAGRQSDSESVRDFPYFGVKSIESGRAVVFYTFGRSVICTLTVVLLSDDCDTREFWLVSNAKAIRARLKHRSPSPIANLSDITSQNVYSTAMAVIRSQIADYVRLKRLWARQLLRQYVAAVSCHWRVRPHVMRHQPVYSPPG